MLESPKGIIKKTPERVYENILRYAGLPSVSQASSSLVKTSRLWEERLINKGYDTDLIRSYQPDYKTIYQQLSSLKFDNTLAYREACREGNNEMVILLSSYVDADDEEKCIHDTTNERIIERIHLRPNPASRVLLSSLNDPEKIELLLRKYTPDTALEQALLTPNITNNIEESIILMISFVSEDVVEPLARLNVTPRIARAFEERGHIYNFRTALDQGLVRSFQSWLDSKPNVRAVESILRELILDDKYYDGRSHTVELVESIVSTATFDLESYFVQAARHRRSEICRVFVRYEVDADRALIEAIKQNDTITVSVLSSKEKKHHRDLARRVGRNVYNFLVEKK